jgi:hypothetical protein
MTYCKHIWIPLQLLHYQVSAAVSAADLDSVIVLMLLLGFSVQGHCIRLSFGKVIWLLSAEFNAIVCSYCLVVCFMEQFLISEY